MAPRDAVSSLWDTGTGEFYSLARLVQRALTGRITPDHLAAECDAQLTRLQSLGVRVAHLDSHRHVHALPAIWKPVTLAARRAGVAAIRVPRVSFVSGGGGGGIHPGRLLVAASLRAALLFAKGPRNDRDLLRTDYFLGPGLLGARHFQRRLLALLDQLQPGTTELVVHPGHVDRDLAAWDSYTAPRERELAALCSREVRERLARGDILLVPRRT